MSMMMNRLRSGNSPVTGLGATTTEFRLAGGTQSLNVAVPVAPRKVFPGFPNSKLTRVGFQNSDIDIFLYGLNEDQAKVNLFCKSKY